MGKAPCIDANPGNADWTKAGALDLPFATLKTRAELEQCLGGMTLEEFKALPIYKWHREFFEGLK